ncbi:MAG TPA: hypothetical protein DIW47_11730 [Bacteroidetes bacterium]|nr:hypothetical protein [Bacteroidota bacterium]
MSRFRIHRPFEEELAKKADEFSMQPSLSTWQGVEKSIAKTRSIQTFWKISILTLSILAVIGILFIQEDRRTANSQATEAGILLLNPLADLPLANENSQASNVNPTKSVGLTKKGGSLSTLAQEETAFSAVDESKFGAEKIFLKNIRPKGLRIAYKAEHANGAAPIRFRKRPAGNKNRDAWYIQANFVPAYAYRNISARTDYARPLEDTKKQLDKGISGFSARVQARYHFSDRFSLAFGLGYTRSGEQVGMAPRINSSVYDALAEQYGYETSEMNAPGDITYYTNEYSYAELPVTLYSKRHLTPRLSLSTGLGLSLAYMMRTNARCYDYRVDHYVNNPEFFRDWSIGSHAQVVLEYSMNTRWSLAAGPEFTYALLSTYRNYYTLSQHQFSMGMNFGVQWKLFDVTKSRLAD